jgi:hypothetical protein
MVIPLVYYEEAGPEHDLKQRNVQKKRGGLFQGIVIHLRRFGIVVPPPSPEKNILSFSGPGTNQHADGSYGEPRFLEGANIQTICPINHRP